MSYASLLSDEYRSVRVAAANQLLGIKNLQSDALVKAVDELLTSNDINSWRGEGNLNQSMVHYNKGQLDKTITSLKNAIKVDPYFTASYINLADVFKNTGDSLNEKQTFKQALAAMPNDGMIHYSYGLYLIRNKEKSQAIQSFKTAVKLEPSNSQYIYLYVLANDNIGKTKQALMQLRMMIKKVDAPQQLAQLGMSLSQKTADRKSYQYFANMMN
jgi:Tfp pilus assembly protein PilF